MTEKVQVVPPNRGLAAVVPPPAVAVERGMDLNPDLQPHADPDDSPTRAAAAVSLAIDGAPYSEIARIHGYASPYHARQAVERALADAGTTPEQRDHQRRIIDRRLNKLLQSVMPKATDPSDVDHLAYNRTALAIVDRQARLWGVDAPATVAMVTPTQEHIAQWIGEMIVLARSAQVVEADIIDAELEN